MNAKELHDKDADQLRMSLLTSRKNPSTCVFQQATGQLENARTFEDR